MTLFINEDEMQSFATQISRKFWQNANGKEMSLFIDSGHVSQNLIELIKPYLKQFEPEYWYIVLSYSRLQLRERYKL